MAKLSFTNSVEVLAGRCPSCGEERRMDIKTTDSITDIVLACDGCQAAYEVANTDGFVRGEKFDYDQLLEAAKGSQKGK